jgi:hypothetical protein
LGENKVGAFTRSLPDEIVDQVKQRKKERKKEKENDRKLFLEIRETLVGIYRTVNFIIATHKSLEVTRRQQTDNVRSFFLFLSTLFQNEL